MRAMKQPIAVILGTRPEIIKMLPVIRAAEARGLPYFILHTGQHYDYNIDKVFFDEFACPAPKYHLGVGSGAREEQVRRMTAGIAGVLRDERPGAVLVQGDTNSVLAGALAATECGVPLGHVEAGLRSFDMTMPEETNRMIADALSAYCFAPTAVSVRNLKTAGVKASSIMLSGNTIVDVVAAFEKRAARESDVLRQLRLQPKKYFLSTIHRQENVDSKERFGAIIRTFRALGERFPYPVIYPMHPRSAKRLSEFGLTFPPHVSVIAPLGFLDFLNLEMNAVTILTDSGGVQEESCILRVPCVTLRENTERPETVTVGANIIAGRDHARVVAAVEKSLDKKCRWRQPFGDGHTGDRIVAYLEKNLQ